jgi:hypothetical protein
MYKVRESAEAELAVRRARYGLTKVPAAAVQSREGFFRTRHHASYRVVKSTAEIVWIVDLDGDLSISTDPEHVVAELFAIYADRRIVYQGIDGMWAELKHCGARFTGYALASALAL